ncbi:hypothetical protein K3495_g5614 [Podosphaera aphanis]|nr:hypothetical protein K3495_g5614 [Podosphaera aphanis]
MIRKAINQQNRLHSDGDEIFWILVNVPNIPPYILTSSADEPTVNEALKGPKKDKWIKAIHHEIDECLTCGTFKFVPRISVKDREHLVTSKWVLKKYKSNMKLDKFKARIVARGFTQTQGVDFNEISSTTARPASWRIIMALAALKNWHVLQADFISAYLAGNLKETIFMKQFPQLKEFFEQNLGTKDKFSYSENSIIELKRPLYGLK